MFISVCKKTSQSSSLSTDLGHCSSHNSSNQLADQVGSHHHQLHAATQVDGDGEGGVEVGAAGGRKAAEKC